MAMMSPPHTDPKLQSLEPTLLIWRNNGRSKSFKTDTNRQPVCNFQASIVSLMITGGGRFPQIVPFQGLKIGVSSGCLGETSIFIARQHTDARYYYSKSVRPLRTGIRWKRLNVLYYFFSPYGSPIILVLAASHTFTKFRWGHSCGGAKYRWGIKISRFWTNKSLYLTNDTRYRHSYYERRI